MPLISGLFYLAVIDVSNDYRTNFLSLQKNTEQSVILAAETVNTGLRIYDSSLDDEMKRSFGIFLEAYNDSGGEPSTMDLQALRDSMGNRYELYIIDENNTVAYTTKEMDRGLDFSNSGSFAEFLAKIREGDSYVGDRASKGVRDVEHIQKYSYYPTPDHKYILELSYNIPKDDARFLLKYGNTVDVIKPLNPYLESVRFYEILGNVIGDSGDYDPVMNEIIKTEVIDRKSDYIIENADTGRITAIRYVDLSESGKGADMSLAIAFTYNSGMLEDQINSVIMLQLGTYLIFVVLFFLVVIFFTRRITGPIRQIVEDVDIIAGGDLEHKIHSSGVKEFVSLEESISNMVDRIVYSLNEKTILLHEVHHRVKNNLQIISGIIQLQSRNIEDESAKDALLMCENRIRTLSSVHDSLYRSDDMSSIDTKEHFTTLAVDIMQSLCCPEGCRIDLDLDIGEMNLPIDKIIPISLVLNEIISNSLKYAFRDREKGVIGIRFRPENGRLLLDVWDDGIGLPADYAARSGSLGLKLVKRLIETQLRGTMTVHTERGTWYSFEIPEK